MPGIAKASCDKKNCTLDYSVEERGTIFHFSLRIFHLSFER